MAQSRITVVHRGEELDLEVVPSDRPDIVIKVSGGTGRATEWISLVDDEWWAKCSRQQWDKVTPMSLRHHKKLLDAARQLIDSHVIKCLEEEILGEDKEEI